MKSSKANIASNISTNRASTKQHYYQHRHWIYQCHTTQITPEWRSLVEHSTVQEK